ncbi:MAG: hypothetical protein R3E62_05865 [Pseudomonadales bacterium]
MNPQAAEYLRLTKVLNEDPGYKYLKKRKQHEQSLLIFGGNFADLMRVLDFIENQDNISEVWRVEAREKQSFLHNEIIRHLHNLLSSSQSLVSHTRSYMRTHHKGQPIFKLYETEVQKTFAQNPLALFIKDLRNYFLHKGIPVSKMEVSFDTETKEPPISKFSLNKLELISWSQWCSGSKTYLNSCEDDLSLRNTVHKYQQEISNFYQWFNDALNNLHKDELAVYEALCEEYRTFETRYSK